jgi:hypothetical protein
LTIRINVWDVAPDDSLLPKDKGKSPEGQTGSGLYYARLLVAAKSTFNLSEMGITTIGFARNCAYWNPARPASPRFGFSLAEHIHIDA